MLKSNSMEFELTPEITDEIIFAMEDQTEHYVFDCQECRCLPAADHLHDEDRYQVIPQWDSVSGFRMMERFVAQLRNPVSREDLRAALGSGHGVFRGFKNILKERPEIERLWYQFKDREMKNCVLEWYNGLRDYWGLERIGMEPEETEDIISDDFSFRHTEEEESMQLDALVDTIQSEVAASLPYALSDAYLDLCGCMCEIGYDDQCILVAESADGQIQGAAISSPVPEGSLLSAHISFIGVYPELRGLGLGKQLLTRTIAHWTAKGYRWLLFTPPYVQESFIPALERSGFELKGQIRVIDLASGACH